MKTICVYCGSSDGKDPAFKQSARDLGEEMVKRNIGLVYGGASIGVMGEIANTVMAGGGSVIGIIPKGIADKEVAHSGLTELIIVKSMHERKAKMAELSDGFISLPGGLGTLEELFEVLTWAQLGFHHKPSGLLNIKGYYDHLIKFLENAVEQDFVKQIHTDMLLKETDPAKLIEEMLAYTPLITNKWIDKDEI
jgi:hypothetical protein